MKNQAGYYLLHVHLRRGYDLAARDANGSSDPYVKFYLRGKVQHKSRIVHKDLNPVWDEQFVLGVEDVLQPLEIKVGGKKDPGVEMKKKKGGGGGRLEKDGCLVR